MGEKPENNPVEEEDWELLTSLFPVDWRQTALSTHALKGLRQDKNEENLLRTLLLHVGCGYSLRETVTRAREAKLADLSDVALLKRLRKSEDWLQSLCQGLFAERALAAPPDGKSFRLLDATLVKEPGKTGSLWRVHYSLQWPALRCDHFKLTASEGVGTSESLVQFPLQPGEYVLADRGYSNATGIHYAMTCGSFLTVRLNPQGVRILESSGRVLNLPKKLEGLDAVGEIRSWPVLIPGDKGQKPVLGKIHAVRKSHHATEKAQKKLLRKASKNGSELKAETLIYAKYVIVFSTFPEERFSAMEVLEAYRIRWQLELVFKRFKQLAHLGHLPKYDEQSARAWLYGKLFVALLAEKLIAHAESFFPWGYSLQNVTHSQPVA
jgi:hypothetical protein